MKKFKFTKFNYNSNVEIKNNPKEFGEELRKLVSLANKRIKRLDDLSPAKKDLYSDAVLKNGKFTAKGSLDDKIRTYNRLKTFINSPTSTKTGFNEYVTNLAERKGISKENVLEMLKKVNTQVGNIIYDTQEIYSLMNNDQKQELPSHMSIEEYDAYVKKQIEESYTSIDDQIAEKQKEYEEFEKNANFDLIIKPEDLQNINDNNVEDVMNDINSNIDAIWDDTKDDDEDDLNY